MLETNENIRGESSPDVSGNAASTVPEPAAGPSTVRRALAKCRVIASTAPLSASAATVLLVASLVSGTLWHAVEKKSWFGDIAYGVPAYADNKWWTPVTGWFFGLTPGQLVSILLMVVTVVAWSEWRLGTRRLAVVMVSGQLLGQLGAALFAWLFSHHLWGTVPWAWPDELATVRDVGITTGVVGAVAAASATLRSPWRLRVRAVLAAYVAVSLLFEGSLTDVSHLIAFVVMLGVGEHFFSGSERGFAPRTRREIRLVGFAGLLVIAVVDVLVWFFPGSGPLGPTDSDDSSTWVMWVHVVVIALIADQLRRGRRWAWWITVILGAINVVALVVVLIAVVTSDYTGQGGVTLGTSLLWLIETLILIAGRFAFDVPWRARTGTAGESTVDDVKALIRTHGGGSMSWMITWPGNKYEFFERQDAKSTAVVGYRKHLGTVLALADPVCARADLENTVRRFIDFAEQSGNTPCWFSVGPDVAAIADGMGWRSVQIAEDTIIDLPDLAFKGKAWQHVRSALNKAKKEDIAFRLTTLADETFSVKAQVRSISQEWVGDKGLPEMGFTLGTVEEAMDPGVQVALAVDGQGNVHGVLSWLPVFGAGGDIRGWTLDVMRRRSDGFGPVIEFLIASSALAFKDSGAAFVSLSGAPLARSAEPGAAEPMDRVLDGLGSAMEPFYGFRSLHAFKKKFNPRYEPVFLSFRDESDLPRIGLAISRAYLPEATPTQLYRLAASGHS